MSFWLGLGLSWFHPGSFRGRTRSLSRCVSTFHWFPNDVQSLCLSKRFLKSLTCEVLTSGSSKSLNFWFQITLQFIDRSFDLVFSVRDSSECSFEQVKNPESGLARGVGTKRSL